MRDADATESTSEAKYSEVRRSQQNITNGHVTLLPGEKQPVIPAIPSGIALPPAPSPSDTNAQGATPIPPQQFTVPQSQPQTATPPPTPPAETSRP